VNALTLPPAPTLPLDAIETTSGLQHRRTPAGAEADRGMQESVASMGILVPVRVRRSPDSATWHIVDGHRRVAAARALNLDSIPVVEDRGDDATATAAGIAANVQRVALAPVDQWRAMVHLQQMGWTLAGAASALGIGQRAARQLDKLGRLHPDVLAAIEAHGMPDDDDLATIALAPRDVQVKAITDKKNWGDHWDEKTNTGNGTKVPEWYDVAGACQEQRVSARRAIFDVQLVGGITWDEDLFAEPGSEDAVTTRDIDAFLTAQDAQLRANSTRATGKKKFHAVPWDKKAHAPALPKGWVRCFDNKTVGAERYAAVQTAGHGIGNVVEIYALPPAKPAQAAAAPKDEAPAQPGGAGESQSGDADADQVHDAEDPAEASDAEGEDEDLGGAFGSAGEAPIPVKPGRGPITAKGQVLVAQAKTTAIRCALRDRRDQSTGDILTALVLALAGDNVTVRGDPTARYTRTTFYDLAAQLVNEDGTPVQGMSIGEVLPIAAEAAARMIVCAPTGSIDNTSGAAAEWIGQLLGAEATMPRLDTPEILATLTGDALRDIARAAGEKVGGSSKALRDRLAGNTERMAAPGSAFSAPGPKRATRRPDGHVGPYPCAGCSDPETCIRDVVCERAEDGADV
jgi:ParB family chromosome partitioning protein